MNARCWVVCKKNINSPWRVFLLNRLSQASLNFLSSATYRRDLTVESYNLRVIIDVLCPWSLIYLINMCWWGRPEFPPQKFRTRVSCAQSLLGWHLSRLSFLKIFLVYYISLYTLHMNSTVTESQFAGTYSIRLWTTAKYYICLIF